MGIVTLHPTQRIKAWRTAYLHGLDELPNSEIAAEVQIWQHLGTPAMAQMGAQLLADRARDAFEIEGGARTSDLIALWKHSDQLKALELVQEQGLTLVAAMRLLHAMSHNDAGARS